MESVNTCEIETAQHSQQLEFVQIKAHIQNAKIINMERRKKNTQIHRSF